MFCVFVGCLPGITRPGWSKRGLRRSIDVAGRGGPQLAVPPGPRFPIAKFWHCIHSLQLSIVSYNVLHSYPRLALDIRL
jgi:hypothetical protein